ALPICRAETFWPAPARLGTFLASSASAAHGENSSLKKRRQLAAASFPFIPLFLSGKGPSRRTLCSRLQATLPPRLNQPIILRQATQQQPRGLVGIHFNKIIPACGPKPKWIILRRENHLRRIIFDAPPPVIDSFGRQRQVGNFFWVDRLVSAVAKHAALGVKLEYAVLAPVEAAVKIATDPVLQHEFDGLHGIV